MEVNGVTCVTVEYMLKYSMPKPICSCGKTIDYKSKKCRDCFLAAHPNSLKTTCPKGHPYDELNTKRGARGERFCRTCDLERSAKKRSDGRTKAIVYLGGKCVDCGYSENLDGLQFDHLPEFGAPTPVDREAIKMTRAWSVIKKELDKCELVCGTCHAIRTAKRRRGV